MICPLLAQGILANRAYYDSYGSLRAWSYSVYIENPTPDPIRATKIKVWVLDSRDSGRALSIEEQIPPTIIPGGKTIRVEFQDEALGVNEIIGGSVECGGNL